MSEVQTEVWVIASATTGYLCGTASDGRALVFRTEAQAESARKRYHPDGVVCPAAVVPRELP